MGSFPETYNDPGILSLAYDLAYVSGVLCYLMLYIISEFSLKLLFLLEMSLNTKAQTSRGDMTSFLETFCYETKIRGFFFFLTSGLQIQCNLPECQHFIVACESFQLQCPFLLWYKLHTTHIVVHLGEMVVN